MTPRLSAAVVIEEQADVISVMNTASGRMMLTNKVGKRILELCDGNNTPAAISTHLAGEFPDAPAQVEEHIRTFLAQAAAKGVIEA